MPSNDDVKITIDVDDSENLPVEELEKKIDEALAKGRDEIVSRLKADYEKVAYNKQVVVVTFEQDMA